MEYSLYCGGRKMLTGLSLELRAREATSADPELLIPSARRKAWQMGGREQGCKRLRTLRMLRKGS